MKTSIEQTWYVASAKAQSTPPKEGNYLIFRIDEESDWNIYGGVDSDGNFLFAIEVSKIPPLIELQSAALDYFRQERKALNAWLMVLRLRSLDLAPVFGRLCQDLIDELQGVRSGTALVAIASRRIQLWQKLFEGGGRGLLADFQVKGLLAELLFMNAEIKSKVRGVLEMANAWIGPAGGDQDFIFSDEAVEVKAIGPNSEGVSISSLQQLDSTIPLRLNVWTMRMASPDEAKSITLNAAVAMVEQLFLSNPQALAKFRSALLEAGYVVNPHYDDLAFEAVGVENFPISESFPRLSLQSVPLGIRSATYVVSLQAIRAAE